MGTRWQLLVGDSGKVELPNCDIRVVEIPKKGDTPQEADRKFEGHPMLRAGRLHAYQGNVNSTGYFIDAEPDTRFQFALTTPTRTFVEDVIFVADPESSIGKCWHPMQKQLAPS